MKRRLLLMALALLVFGGCAKQYQVTLDGISASPASQPGTYVLLPGDQKIGPEDLLFQNIAGYLQKALSRKGYRRTASLARAEQAITLDYEVSGPQIISRVHTDYSAAPYYNYWYYPNTYTSHHRVYTRRLLIKAYEAKSYNSPQRMQYWRLLAVSTGSTSDMREIIPIMITAAEPYLGVNTKRQINVVINGDDPGLTQ